MSPNVTALVTKTAPMVGPVLPSALTWKAEPTPPRPPPPAKLTPNPPHTHLLRCCRLYTRHVLALYPYQHAGPGGMHVRLPVTQPVTEMDAVHLGTTHGNKGRLAPARVGRGNQEGDGAQGHRGTGHTWGTGAQGHRGTGAHKGHRGTGAHKGHRGTRYREKGTGVAATTRARCVSAAQAGRDTPSPHPRYVPAALVRLSLPRRNFRGFWTTIWRRCGAGSVGHARVQRACKQHHCAPRWDTAREHTRCHGRPGLHFPHPPTRA